MDGMHVSRYTGYMADICMNRGVLWGLEASICAFLIQTTHGWYWYRIHVFWTLTPYISTKQYSGLLCSLFDLELSDIAGWYLSDNFGVDPGKNCCARLDLDVIKIYNSMLWISSISWSMRRPSNVCDITPWILWMSINLFKSTTGAARMPYVACNSQSS